MTSSTGLKNKIASIKEKELIEGCLKGNRNAQEQLYRQMAPVMLMVCKRYLYDYQKAEAIVNQGFLKVFQKLDTYKSKGSFEGWVRKIMVRESLNENQKRKPLNIPIEEQEAGFLRKTPEVDEIYDVGQIMAVIKALPQRYREIFNLYEIEGYSHKEIAVQLDIKESTSRSQLTRAKELLRKKLGPIKGF